MSESHHFEIAQKAEQRPFEEQAARHLLERLAAINDKDLKLRFVPRDEVGAEPDGSVADDAASSSGETDETVVIIADDLHLWEIPELLENLDNDTHSLTESAQSELKLGRGEKVRELGRTMEDVGIYLARRVDGMTKGRDVAAKTAEDFYNYGQALATGERLSEPATVERLSQEPAADAAATERVDRWLLGDALYERRRLRAELLAATGQPLDETLEAERSLALNQFFGTAETAFRLREQDQQKAEPATDAAKHKAEPIARPAVHEAFLTGAHHRLERAVNEPKVELGNSIFDRGLAILQDEMTYDKLPRQDQVFIDDLATGSEKLRDALDLDGMKHDLDAMRESGDRVGLARMEKYCGDRIQDAVSRFPYDFDKADDSRYSPAHMLADQTMICVGFSLLGASLMKEVGIRTLEGSTGDHSLLFSVSSDGTVTLREMQAPADKSIVLTPDNLHGKNSDGTIMSPGDIAEAADASGFVKTGEFAVDGYDRRHMRAGSVEGGLQISELIWLSNEPANADYQRQFLQRVLDIDPANVTALRCLGRHAEAIKVAERDAAIFPDNPAHYLELGESYYRLNQYGKARSYLEEAAARQPDNDDVHHFLGNACFKEKDYDAAYREFLEVRRLKPDSVSNAINVGAALSMLGHNEEAIKEFESLSEKDEGYSLAVGNLSYSLVKLNRLDEAEANADKALGLDGDLNTPNFVLGMVAEKRGNRDEAFEHYERYLSGPDVDEDDEDTKEVRAFVASYRGESK